GSLFGGAGLLVCQATGRDDDAVPHAPTGDRLGQGDGVVPFLGGGAELDPGAAQGGAVEVHAPPAANDGRAGLLGQAVDVLQAEQSGVPGVDGLVGSADLQGGPGPPGGRLLDVGLTVEAVLARVVAGLYLDQADVQAGVPVRGEAEGAGDMDG